MATQVNMDTSQTASLLAKVSTTLKSEAAQENSGINLGALNIANQNQEIQTKITQVMNNTINNVINNNTSINQDGSVNITFAAIGDIIDANVTINASQQLAMIVDEATASVIKNVSAAIASATSTSDIAQAISQKNKGLDPGAIFGIVIAVAAVVVLGGGALIKNKIARQLNWMSIHPILTFFMGLIIIGIIGVIIFIAKPKKTGLGNTSADTPDPNGPPHTGLP